MSGHRPRSTPRHVDPAARTGSDPAAHGDRGSATVWAAGAIAVLCLLAAVVLTYGDIVRTRHRAVAAADLAALAGAAYAQYGESAACDRARWVAAGMGVGVTSCRLSRWDALVEIATDLPDGFGTLAAHSRAGPSRPPDGEPPD